MEGIRSVCGKIGKKPAALVLLALAGAVFAHGAFADDLLDLAMSTFEPSKAASVIADLKARGGDKADLYVGIVEHNLAFADPANHVEKAIALLESYWKKKSDPIALAYLGSSYTLRGSLQSSRGDFIGAAASVDQGFKHLDKAVELSPRDANIRFLRAENGIGVSESSPFKRWDIVEADLKALEPMLSGMKPETVARWWLLTGKLAQGRGKIGDAIKAYEKAIRTAPDSSAAKEAKARLAKLEE